MAMKPDQLKYIAMFYSRAARKYELDRQIKSCDQCWGLNLPGGTENAPGYGNVCSPIFFIGQSLCNKCMNTQIPFTRGSGDVLDEIFMSVGKMKYDFFITNVVHCHPPGNRESTLEEMKNCASFLEEEIKLVLPKVIVALGKDAKRSLEKLGVKFGNEEFVLSRSEIFGFKVHVTAARHPAYLLYRPNKKVTERYKHDLRALLEKWK